MTRNIGIPERVLRALLGIGLLGLYGALYAPWKYFTLVGLLLLGTAITGTCPVYTLAAKRGLRFGGPEPKPRP